jgi:hypothetical protein
VSTDAVLFCASVTAGVSSPEEPQEINADERRRDAKRTAVVCLAVNLISVASHIRAVNVNSFLGGFCENVRFVTNFLGRTFLNFKRCWYHYSIAFIKLQAFLNNFTKNIRDDESVFADSHLLEKLS